MIHSCYAKASVYELKNNYNDVEKCQTKGFDLQNFIRA